MKDFHVRRGMHWMVISLFLAVAACGGDTGTNTGGTGGTGGSGGGSNPVATMSVTVGNNFFDPDDILVSPGAMVTWTWGGGVTHNVTFASSLITNSGNRSNGIRARKRTHHKSITT